MKQKFKNVQSMKEHPLKTRYSRKMHMKIKDVKNNSYSNQTGKISCRSSHGHQYIFVGFNSKANYIKRIPLRNQNGNESIQAFEEFSATIKEAGITPQYHIIDNECSQKLKQCIENHGITFQKVPPNTHQNNTAEQAIQTWKAHFISGICGTDNNFPL